MVVDKAHTVERFNRTLKEHIHRRLNAMSLDTDKWTSQLEAGVNKYNNTEHRTIKMSPSEARKESNKLTTSFNIWATSKKDRVCPELNVGDEVRIMLTTDSKTKSYMPKWSTDLFNVIVVKDHADLVNTSIINVYLRHELVESTNLSLDALIMN